MYDGLVCLVHRNLPQHVGTLVICHVFHSFWEQLARQLETVAVHRSSVVFCAFRDIT